MRSLLRLLLPCVLAFSPLAAAVRVPAILGSHMVLQQRASVPVWGWANAAETVVVTQLINRVLRYAVQRTRPPEHFGLFTREPGERRADMRSTPTCIRRAKA